MAKLPIATKCEGSASHSCNGDRFRRSGRTSGGTEGAFLWEGEEGETPSSSGPLYTHNRYTHYTYKFRRQILMEKNKDGISFLIEMGLFGFCLPEPWKKRVFACVGLDVWYQWREEIVVKRSGTVGHGFDWEREREKLSWEWVWLSCGGENWDLIWICGGGVLSLRLRFVSEIRTLNDEWISSYWATW